MRIAVVVAVLAVLAGCERYFEGSDCETIGEEACQGHALYVCDGSAWHKVTDCHSQCSILSAPTVHDQATLAGDETWRCEESPHLVTTVLGIADGATLTITAGAEVRFAPGARIDTSPESRLVAEGADGAPILFTSDDDTKGGWGAFNQGGLNLFARDEGEAGSVLRHALVERAVNGVGLLSLADDKIPPVIEQSQLRDNLTWGVIVRGCVGEPAIPDLESEESGNDFFGNGEGAISQCDPS